MREPTIDSLEDRPLDPGAERVQAIEGLDRPVEDNPYEAVGIRFGTFILKPSIEQGVTATSNADFSADGSEAVLSETTLRLNAASDWSSHSAAIDAYGTFRKTLSGQEVDDVAGGVDAELELELGNEYRARGTFNYSVAPESAASPVVIEGTADEPLRQTVGGTLGLEKACGKARFGITGGISHDSYGDADLEGGGVLSQRDRNSTLYSVALRAGYEISPALTPFVETEIGRNLYDQEVDSAGFRALVRSIRRSRRPRTRHGRKALRRAFGRLDIRGFRRPQARTAFVADVRGRPDMVAATRHRRDAGGGDHPRRHHDGRRKRVGALCRQHRHRAPDTRQPHRQRQFSAQAWRNYSESDGYDLILSAEASLTWWLNRYAGVVTRARYETVSSNLPDRDAETNSIFLGLKLQR